MITVERLIERLKNYPPDALVLHYELEFFKDIHFTDKLAPIQKTHDPHAHCYPTRPCNSGCPAGFPQQ